MKKVKLNNPFAGIKLISLIISFFFFMLIPVFFLPSCGFVSGVGGSFIQESRTGGDPGDGDTPTLASRIKETPDLADVQCEDNDRCEEACRDIYEDSDSYRDCYKLTIEKVSNLENVFYALVKADPEELEDIKDDDLESYLRISFDGWRNKVITKQKLKGNKKTRFENTLKWIVKQEKDVVPLLQREDQDNEILKQLFLEYCEDADGICANSSIGITFDSAGGELFFKGKKIAFIAEENKDVFKSLLYNGAYSFFEEAAYDRSYDAFALGNKVLEQACTTRNDISSEQCVRGFYCWLSTQYKSCRSSGSVAESCIDSRFFRSDILIDEIGREIILDKDGNGTSCEATEFTDII